MGRHWEHPKERCNSLQQGRLCPFAIVLNNAGIHIQAELEGIPIEASRRHFEVSNFSVLVLYLLTLNLVRRTSGELSVFQ